MFKNLKVNHIRPPFFLVFSLAKYFIKIPLSLNSYKELVNEKKNIDLVKNDLNFKPYLVESRYFLNFIMISNFYPQINGSDQKQKLVEQYFLSAFKNVSTELLPLIKLVDSRSLYKFISENINKNLASLDLILSNKFLPVSSIHGDFHPENILVASNCLKFIDWTRYNRSSSLYFDLFDYYIFSHVEKGKSWIEAWKDEYANRKDKIFDIDILPAHYLSYAIWKISEELKTLYLRNDLSNSKINKYSSFIQYLDSLS